MVCFIERSRLVQLPSQEPKMYKYQSLALKAFVGEADILNCHYDLINKVQKCKAFEIDDLKVKVLVLFFCHFATVIEYKWQFYQFYLVFRSQIYSTDFLCTDVNLMSQKEKQSSCETSC